APRSTTMSAKPLQLPSGEALERSRPQTGALGPPPQENRPSQAAAQSRPAPGTTDEQACAVAFGPVLRPPRGAQAASPRQLTVKSRPGGSSTGQGRRHRCDRG